MPLKPANENHPDPGAQERAIRVSADLLDELRSYCDRNGIRFLAFVEEALEKATYVDQIETLLHDGATLLEKLEAERRRGVALGFSLGVLAATLALQGILEPGRHLTPEAVGQFLMSRPVSGEQLKLFD
ncbi:MAG TPA: hypothetical protein ENF48_05965 [Desulfobacteraceae bacterium]|nr:hypothetical protein [Deltaproteobacteria bacterium]HDI59880.1 hypothetical protein [Desulfobacteraceae bacterium]